MENAVTAIRYPEMAVSDPVVELAQGLVPGNYLHVIGGGVNV